MRLMASSRGCHHTVHYHARMSHHCPQVQLSTSHTNQGVSLGGWSPAEIAATALDVAPPSALGELCAGTTFSFVACHCWWLRFLAAAHMSHEDDEAHAFESDSDSLDRWTVTRSPQYGSTQTTLRSWLYLPTTTGLLRGSLLLRAQSLLSRLHFDYRRARSHASASHGTARRLLRPH